MKSQITSSTFIFTCMANQKVKNTLNLIFLLPLILIPNAYAEPRMATQASMSYGATPPLPKPAIAPVGSGPYNSASMAPAVASRSPAPPTNNFGKQVGFTPSLPRVGDPPPRWA